MRVSARLEKQIRYKDEKLLGVMASSSAQVRFSLAADLVKQRAFAPANAGRELDSDKESSLFGNSKMHDLRYDSLGCDRVCVGRNALVKNKLIMKLRLLGFIAIMLTLTWITIS